MIETETGRTPVTIDLTVRPDQPNLSTTVRRRLRVAVRRVRCESRLISRYVFNPMAVWSFRAGPPVLSGEAARVVGELRSSGVVMTTVDKLLGSTDPYRRVRDRIAELREQQSENPDPSKPYLVELLGARPAISADDPIAAFALLPEVRGIAEVYAQMKLRVQDVNVWVNTPTGGDATQSQRWHRDLPEDHDIVKCFVYFSDVTPGSGPLQYAPRTNTRSGRRLKFQTEFDGIGYRIPDAAVAQTFGDEVVTATGPEETMVFADTRGVHRGGFAVDSERVVLQITYASNACCRPRNLVPADDASDGRLHDFRMATK
jgi:hypothetical protein